MAFSKNRMIGAYEVRDEDLFDVYEEVKDLKQDHKTLLSLVELNDVFKQLGYNGDKKSFKRQSDGKLINFNNDVIRALSLIKNYNPSEAECYIYKHFNSDDKFKRYTEFRDQIKEQLKSLGGGFDTRFQLIRRGLIPSQSKTQITSRPIGIKEDPNYFYTYGEVENRFIHIWLKNLDNEDVFLRPVSDRYDFIVLNNIFQRDIENLYNDDVIPNLVLETAEEKYQAVFVYPKHMPNEVFHALERELALRYGATLSQTIYKDKYIHIADTTFNTSKEHDKFHIQIAKDISYDISDGLKSIALEVLKRPHKYFEKLIDVIEGNGTTNLLEIDYNLALHMHVHCKDDFYLSDEEQYAMLAGNGINDKVKAGNRDYIYFNILKKIDEEFPKKYKPVIECPLFSKADPFFKPRADFELHEDVMKDTSIEHDVLSEHITQTGENSLERDFGLHNVSLGKNTETSGEVVQEDSVQEGELHEDRDIEKAKVSVSLFSKWFKKK